MIKNLNKNKKSQNKCTAIMYHYIKKNLNNKVKLNYLEQKIFKKQISFLENKNKIINPLDLKKIIFTKKPC